MFHSELMNEANHLQSVTVGVNQTQESQRKCPEKKYPELISSTSADLSEFTSQEMQKLGSYYSSSTHSQHESFYQNWQKHFQPK
jgi:hypothetical protein